MDDCLFCKIIKGEIPSLTIYEDDIVKVFLDINPSTNGHSLIVPKKHYENMQDIDDETYMHIHNTAKELEKIYKEKLSCEGLTLMQNNGLGQDVKHYHLHLIPRYKNDNMMHEFNKEVLIDTKKIYEQIKK